MGKKHPVVTLNKIGRTENTRMSNTGVWFYLQLFIYVWISVHSLSLKLSSSHHVSIFIFIMHWCIHSLLIFEKYYLRYNPRPILPSFCCNIVYQGGWLPPPLWTWNWRAQSMIVWNHGSPLSIDTKNWPTYDVTMTFLNMAGLKQRIFSENRPKLKKIFLFR